MKQDRSTIISRLARKIIMSLVAGSLFFDLPDEQSGISYKIILFLYMSVFYVCQLTIWHRFENKTISIIFWSTFLEYGISGLNFIILWCKESILPPTWIFLLLSFSVSWNINNFLSILCFILISIFRYFICKTILELIMMAYENIVFACILYWMVGLQADIGRFFYFFLTISVYVNFIFSIFLFIYFIY